MKKSKNPGKTSFKEIEPASAGEIKEFHYKTDKIEKGFTIAAFIFFIFTVIYDKNIPLLLGFFAFVTVIILYYAIWFRKKPPYVKISGEDITISQGIFFKPVIIRKGMIQDVISSSTVIEIKLMASTQMKNLKIFKLFLSDNDAAEVSSFLTSMKQ